MSYTIKKSDGSTLATVPENQIITNAASVSLVGRGATTYGVAHAQNFIYMLENFANVAPPANALEGQMWWDTTVGVMKVRKGNEWVLLGGSGGGSGNNVAGAIFVQIEDSSVLVFVAGGVVVSVIAPRDFAVASLPVSITLLSTPIPFQARFPYGLQGGSTLASDPGDYVYQGHVPQADQSIFAGGGDPLAATTYIDLGSVSVGLTISNSKLIAAYSGSIIPADQLPLEFTLNGITMPFRAVFPAGLVAGLTLGDTFSIKLGAGGEISGGGGQLTIGVVQELITAEATARASAVTNFYSYANANYASAGIIDEVKSSFTTATGTTSLADAINYIITSASEGTAGAEAGTKLRAEIKNAITGATSFAEALRILNVTVTKDTAKASDVTALEARVTDEYTKAIGKAVEGVFTNADLNSVTSAAVLELEANFETATGYSSIATAVNNLKTIATGTGNVVSQDTELRAQFTNAMAVGSPAGTINSVAKAFEKLKYFGGDIGTQKANMDNLVGLLKNLTGTGLQESLATAINKLTTSTSLGAALSQSQSDLKASIASDMSEGGATTIADAVNSIIRKAQTNEDGSSSSVDTDLRNAFITLTSESGFPVTSISEAVQKLMSNTTKDRSNSAAIQELQNTFTGITGSTTVAVAKQKLTSTVTKTDASAEFVNDLQAKFTSSTGVANWSTAVDTIIANANAGGSASTRTSALESAFTTATGETNVASAVQKLWTQANATSTVSGYTLKVGSNNSVTGMTLVNGGPGSDLNVVRFDADKFIVASAADPVGSPTFEIVNGAAYIKGEKIQSGTITSTQICNVTPGNIQMSQWNAASLNITFPQGTVPAGARALITVGLAGQQTGSTADPYSISILKTAISPGGEPIYQFDGYTYVIVDYTQPGMQTVVMPGNSPTFNFLSTKGCSCSWTFCDDNITPTHASGPITYSLQKTLNGGAGGGRITFATMTALMGKK
jgi:hypothetical protein